MHIIWSTDKGSLVEIMKLLLKLGNIYQFKINSDAQCKELEGRAIRIATRPHGNVLLWSDPDVAPQGSLTHTTNTDFRENSIVYIYTNIYKMKNSLRATIRLTAGEL